MGKVKADRLRPREPTLFRQESIITMGLYKKVSLDKDAMAQKYLLDPDLVDREASIST